MPLLRLEEAAGRVGVSKATLEDWIEWGLLTVQPQPCPKDLPPNARAEIEVEPWVEEEELLNVAESLGWLLLGSWDSEYDFDETQG